MREEDNLSGFQCTALFSILLPSPVPILVSRRGNCTPIAPLFHKCLPPVTTRLTLPTYLRYHVSPPVSISHISPPARLFSLDPRPVRPSALSSRHRSRPFSDRLAALTPPRLVTLHLRREPHARPSSLEPRSRLAPSLCPDISSIHCRPSRLPSTPPRVYSNLTPTSHHPRLHPDPASQPIPGSSLHYRPLAQPRAP